MQAAPTQAAREQFLPLAGEAPGVQVIDESEIRRFYPVENWYDASGDGIGRIPYTETYFAALGTALVRRAHALLTAPYKAVAVDCDNTLWLGTCGEDGPEGVTLGASRRALHEFLLAQREAGLLLCLCSKNNEADVWETFAAHPEFPLQPRHFTAWRLNWESKAANIGALAEELNIGTDTFIFLDDNARETAEVAGSLPEVLSLTLPEDGGLLPLWLDHLWAFDHPVVTEEDRRRSSSVAQTREFGRELRAASNLEEFVSSLELRVDVAPLAAERFSRAAQLTQRTNQFNCTSVRRTEAELHALLQTGRYEIFTAEVSDRFGDYGLTGLLIVEKREDEYRAETFLLSCRVLGRGVEHRLLAFLGEHAEENGVHHVTVPFTPSRRNRPACDFLEAVSGGRRMETPGGLLYSFEATAIQGLRWKPGRKSEVGEPRPARPAPAARGFVEFDRIARELRTPEQVLAEMRREARSALRLETGRWRGANGRRTAAGGDLGRDPAAVVHLGARQLLRPGRPLVAGGAAAAQGEGGVRRRAVGGRRVFGNADAAGAGADDRGAAGGRRGAGGVPGAAGRDRGTFGRRSAGAAGGGGAGGGRPAGMRILLTSNTSCDPPRGGSTRANLAWLRHLAAQGHACRAVASTPAGDVRARAREVDGIAIRGVPQLQRHPDVLAGEIRTFAPDWVLVSSEDVAQVLVRAAAQAAPGRMVYLAHTPQFLPFGPESWNADERAAAAIRRAAGVVVIGQHMAGYVRTHLGVEPVVIHPPIYGRPPYRQFGHFGSGVALMVNPCAVKGICDFSGAGGPFSGRSGLPRSRVGGRRRRIARRWRAVRTCV